MLKSIVAASVCVLIWPAEPASAANQSKRHYYRSYDIVAPPIYLPFSGGQHPLDNTDYARGTYLPSHPPGQSPWFAKKFYDWSDRYNTGGSGN